MVKKAFRLQDDLLKKIAAALEVETAALADPVVTSNIGAMYAFFEMEERYGLELRKESGGKISLFFPFSEGGINTCLKEWYTRREEYLSDLEKASSKEEKEALTREYHFWEWNYPTVLAKENSRKLRESYLKKKLQHEKGIIMILTREVENFLAVARYQSLKAASEHLSITVPALSQKMKSLEYKVGVPLFDRYNRGMRLTPAGKLLAEKMEKARKLEEEAVLLARREGGRSDLERNPEMRPFCK